MEATEIDNYRGPRLVLLRILVTLPPFKNSNISPALTKKTLYSWYQVNNILHVTSG